jgi:hypothetical protein
LSQTNGTSTEEEFPAKSEAETVTFRFPSPQETVLSQTASPAEKESGAELALPPAEEKSAEIPVEKSVSGRLSETVEAIRRTSPFLTRKAKERVTFQAEESEKPGANESNVKPRKELHAERFPASSLERTLQ